MKMHTILAALVVLLAISDMVIAKNRKMGKADKSEHWGYIEVRPKAHVFWWLYHSPGRTGDSWPLILWLQGGPGASSVGIGNFQEIGPLNTNLQPRNSTWLQKADLLFVDSPVGTGYSYVENQTLLATSDQQAVEDLLNFLKGYSKTVTHLKNTRLFIVAESYGGKHASMLGVALSKAIAAGEINVKLGGVVLGDSWISPVDFVYSWGPLLKTISRLDASNMEKANSMAKEIDEQVKRGQYVNATQSWAALESFISSTTSDVDFYNFLLDSSTDPLSTTTTATNSLQTLKFGTPEHQLHYLTSKVGAGQNNSQGDLDSLMNGVVREKLNIIPTDVKWGGQSDLVFSALEGNFMKDTISEVDELLARGEKVTIYNGQVDVICATMGTESWVQKLRWSGLKAYNTKERKAIFCADNPGTKGFVKSYKNLQFFWVLGAGHFVPVDQPCLALQMLDMFTQAASH